MNDRLRPLMAGVLQMLPPNNINLLAQALNRRGIEPDLQLVAYLGRHVGRR
ncbi:MAG TPA: hypothetical protein VGW38_20550 [Chloroflexota bacterium]|nr:hypothetical protein [Chloroflexota bacterium]